MKYNLLGRSDLSVSEIGFGAMSLDMALPSESMALLHDAFEHGINFFDTADLYDKGQNETLVGKAVKNFRKEIVLASKVGNKWTTDGKSWEWDVSSSYIRQAIDQSLKRLQTDYIDLYQIHGGTNQDDFDEVVATLEDLVDEGKIRYYGISSIRPNVFTEYCKNSNIVSNMMQYSILDTRAEQYLSVFQESQVSVIARGTLAQGLLVNKIAKTYLGHSQEEVFALQSQIKAYCTEYNVSSTSLALSYVLRESSVASALVGIHTKDQMDSILQSYQELELLKQEIINFDINKLQYKDHLY